MSTTSNVASVRPANSAATQAATESLTRPGRVLPVMMAILGRPAAAPVGAAAFTGAAPAAATADTASLAVSFSRDTAAAASGLAADRRALDLLKRFLNQDMAAFDRLLDVSTIL